MSLGITEPKVLLMRGRGLVSAAIRWQTRSVYSHAAMQMRDGRLVESWQGAGVRVKRLTDWRGVDAFRVPSATPEQWDRAIKFCKARIGAKYDYANVVRFVDLPRLLRPFRKPPDHGDARWFCSELVFAAFLGAGLPLLARCEEERVSPGLLALSPLLEPLPGYRGEAAV